MHAGKEGKAHWFFRFIKDERKRSSAKTAKKKANSGRGLKFSMGAQPPVQGWAIILPQMEQFKIILSIFQGSYPIIQHNRPALSTLHFMEKRPCR